MSVSGVAAPAKVIVWGGGDFDEAVAEMAISAGVSIVARAGSPGSLAKGSARRLLSPADILADDGLRQLPILVALRHQPLGNADPAAFRQALAEIVGAGLPNRVLHPVALLPRLEPHGGLKLCYFGFQGSGNVICGNILQRLFQLAEAADSPRRDTLRMLAVEHETLLDTAMAEAFDPRGRTGWEAQANRVGRKLYMHRFENGRFLDIIDVPSFLYSDLRRRYFNSHERLSEITFRSLQAAGCAILLTWRHPLDVIVSCAAKIDRSPERPAQVLADLRWFHAVASDIRDYFLRMLPFHGRAEVIRYEDLLRDPARAIRRLAELACVSATDAQIAGLWDEVGLQPLPKAPPRHFWNPSAGKWRQHLTASHFNILHDLRYPEFLEAVDYPSRLPPVDPASPGTPEGVGPPLAPPDPNAPPRPSDYPMAPPPILPDLEPAATGLPGMLPGPVVAADYDADDDRDDFHLRPDRLARRDNVVGEVSLISNDAGLAASAERLFRTAYYSRLLTTALL